MYPHMLPDYRVLINQQIVMHEVLLGQHLKAEAMLEVLLGTNLLTLTVSTLHHCLLGIDQNIIEAKTLNERLLNLLLQIVKDAKPPQRPPDAEPVH